MWEVDFKAVSEWQRTELRSELFEERVHSLSPIKFIVCYKKNNILQENNRIQMAFTMSRIQSKITQQKKQENVTYLQGEKQ